MSRPKSNSIHNTFAISRQLQLRKICKLNHHYDISSGGLIVLVSREYDVTIAEYKDRLEPLMKQLEDEGKWTILERTVFPEYHPEVNGIVFVFKVTK